MDTFYKVCDGILFAALFLVLTSLYIEKPKTKVIYVKEVLELRTTDTVDVYYPINKPLPEKYKPRNRVFKMYMHPILKRIKMHNGVDVTAPLGTPITPLGSGYVVRANYSKGFGKVVEIRHNDSLTSLYAHCSKINVKKGDFVSISDTIGLVGSTGLSTCPHLHLSIKKKGLYVNPQNYVYGRESKGQDYNSQHKTGTDTTRTLKRELCTRIFHRRDSVLGLRRDIASRGYERFCSGN